MTQSDVNKKLSAATFVSGLGDFISLFASIVLVHDVTDSVATAAYLVPIKALALGVAGLTVPSLLNRVDLRRVIIWSQFLSAALVGCLVAIAIFDPCYELVFGVIFLQTILHKYFIVARESYSKGLGGTTEQRGLQAQILSGLYSAQLVGPLLSIGLIKIFPIYVPFIIDTLSFIVTGVMCMSIPIKQKQKVKMHILRPLSYLYKNSTLLHIFLIRSVGYWIPIGMLNYLLFSIVFKKFNLEIEDSALVYAVIGLGSMIATKGLSGVEKRGWIGRLTSGFFGLSDAKIAFSALIMLAVTRVSFLECPNFVLGLVPVFLGGICNGLNAVTTQSLRRKLTSIDQFPEISGLEVVVGKITDWLAATATFYALSSNYLSYRALTYVGALFLITVAVTHLFGNLKEA